MSNLEDPVRSYLTTTIPYVNAKPHIGFALELVQADVLARQQRRLGGEVRFQTGTDDNSLKNVLAARAEGVGVREFVDRNADAFVALHEPLGLSVDDVIRTSSDPRHRAGVERLWHACADDLYRRHYEGRYCVGCEQFYTDAELVDGRCPEHGTEPELVAEENWFFRLSRYAEPLRELITSGRLRVEPEQRRNEVLGLIDGGLLDFSVSRGRERAHGWGIPVPGDDSQVVYVWWDALGNYLTALDYGNGGAGYEHWWTGADRRIHLLGKGVLRFHAVYWPAILLSAGLEPPTELFVHDYLTVDGRKISKSAGGAVDPVALVDEFGTDPLRWTLLREVPKVGDTDFTVGKLVARTNEELVNGLGNLVNRVVSMVHRYRGGQVPAGGTGELADDSAERLDRALADYDFRRASGVVWASVVAANRYVNRTRPWALAKTGDPALDGVLAELVGACREIAGLLVPFLPDTARRITGQCTAVGGRLPTPTPLFSRIAAPSRPVG